MKAKTIEQQTLNEILNLISSRFDDVLNHKVSSLHVVNNIGSISFPLYCLFDEIILNTENIDGKYFEISIKQKIE